MYRCVAAAYFQTTANASWMQLMVSGIVKSPCVVWLASHYSGCSWSYNWTWPKQSLKPQSWRFSIYPLCPWDSYQVGPVFVLHRKTVADFPFRPAWPEPSRARTSFSKLRLVPSKLEKRHWAKWRKEVRSLWLILLVVLDWFPIFYHGKPYFVSQL